MAYSKQAFFVIFFLLSGCGYYGMPIEGKVYDIDTGIPLEGAIVVARWEGFSPVPVDSIEICYHVLSTKSDKNGNYRFDFWWQREGAGNEVVGKSVSLDTYLNGYELAKQEIIAKKDTNRNNLPMQKFSRNNNERRALLASLRDVECNQAGDTYSNLYHLRKAVYTEAKSLIGDASIRKYGSWAVYSLMRNSPKYKDVWPEEYSDSFILESLGENP